MLCRLWYKSEATPAWLDFRPSRIPRELLYMLLDGPQSRPEALWRVSAPAWHLLLALEPLDVVFAISQRSLLDAAVRRETALVAFGLVIGQIR